MKGFGWTSIILGIMMLYVEASKGDSVLAPLFVIGLGIYFLYRANNKETDENKDDKKNVIEAPVKEEPKRSVSDSPVSNPVKSIQPHVERIDVKSEQEPESLEDIQSQLSMLQREAAMCLVSFFGGYNNNLTDETPMMIARQAAGFFGIPFNPQYMTQILSKYTDADALVDIVLTIKPRKAKEFLLLTCHDLIKNENNDEANFLLGNIAKDMGYDSYKFRALINQYQ